MMKDAVFIVLVLSVVLFSSDTQVSGTYFDSGTSWYTSTSWCKSTNKLFLGDFNGDGQTDLLCHSTTGYKWISLANEYGRFSGTSWHKAVGWCAHSGSQLLIGDFNGDGRSDLLCHDIRGNKWVSLANSDGSFTGTSWHKAMGWCTGSGSRLLIGDFNGDGRSDLLCHDVRGNKWVSLANSDGSFTGTSWHKAMGWCAHSGSQLLIGDFNNDGRDDMLCHDNRGKKWISLANCGGSFLKTDWSKNMNWCGHSSSELHIGTFNEDGCADLLCHGKTNGKKWIALNKLCNVVNV